MKAIKVRSVDMVRRIRDRQAKALAGKSAAEVIAFYHAAGRAAMRDAAPSVADRRKSVDKVPQPTSRTGKVRTQRPSRAARG